LQKDSVKSFLIFVEISTVQGWIINLTTTFSFDHLATLPPSQVLAEQERKEAEQEVGPHEL